MNNSIKVVFFGTPEFAAPFLKALLADDNFVVSAVVTQPDKPTGRKQLLSPSPIKVLAQEKKLPVFQPVDLKNNQKFIAELKSLAPDLLAVVAFGEILPLEILNIAKIGSINVHPSLLPKYRGASPAQAAILNGEEKTGVSIILMDEEMDHGPILAQKEIKLTGEETNDSLHQNLAEIGKLLLIQTLLDFSQNKIKFQPQNDQEATFCREIKKEEAKINWQESAEIISRKIRAFYPWPIAWTTLAGKRLKIFPPVEIIKKIPTAPAYVGEHRDSDPAFLSAPDRGRGIGTKEIGKVIIENNKLIVICGDDNKLAINKLQIEGKKEMSAADFLRGYGNIILKNFGF